MPLVIPEINAGRIREHKGIIAVPKRGDHIWATGRCVNGFCRRLRRIEVASGAVLTR